MIREDPKFKDTLRAASTLLFVLAFSFLPVTQDNRFKSDLPVFTQQVGITGSFTRRRAGHSAPHSPLSSFPITAQRMLQPCTSSQMLFPPSQLCRELFLHPCGLCARLPFPNPFCCSTGSCQSSLCPRPRLPPSSNSVYTPCWICSACHLQRHCLRPAKTPQIQLSLVPPPASALGQGILFQRSSQ